MFLVYRLWSSMHHSVEPTKPASRHRVIPDIGRSVSHKPTMKDTPVSRDDIQRTIDIHPHALTFKLHHRHHQFHLSITAQSVLKQAPSTQSAETASRIYAFMQRWGQTAYLYRLIHEAPMEGTVEFQLPMHHAMRDPSNNTTL